MVIEPFEIGFYPLDTFNIPTDSENEWEEAKSNKGMTILYRSYDTQISYKKTKRPFKLLNQNLGQCALVYQ